MSKFKRKAQRKTDKTKKDIFSLLKSLKKKPSVGKKPTGMLDMFKKASILNKKQKGKAFSFLKKKDDKKKVSVFGLLKKKDDKKPKNKVFELIKKKRD